MPIGPLADMQYLSKFRSLSSPDLFAGACGNEMKRHINWSRTNYNQAFCRSKDPTTNNRYNWWTPFGSGEAMNFLSLISIFCWLHALFRQRVSLQARRSSGGPRRMPKKGALGICASTVLLSRGCDPKNPFGYQNPLPRPFACHNRPSRGSWGRDSTCNNHTKRSLLQVSKTSTASESKVRDSLPKNHEPIASQSTENVYNG